MALISTSTTNPMPRIIDQECVTWLRTMLKDGPVPSADLKKAASEEGYGRIIFRRAKRILGVPNEPDGARGTWLCRLPD